MPVQRAARRTKRRSCPSTPVRAPIALAPRLLARRIRSPKVVGPTGNAPVSVAYQAAALLLSYGPMKEWRRAVNSHHNRQGRSVRFRGDARAVPGSPSKNWRREVVMLHSRRSADPTCFQHVPSLARFSLRWRKTGVLIPSDVSAAPPASNGCPRLAGSPSLKSLHGWICTTMRPFRRRQPDLFAPRGGKWRA